jgi:hypothetical protein
MQRLFSNDATPMFNRWVGRFQTMQRLCTFPAINV